MRKYNWRQRERRCVIISSNHFRCHKSWRQNARLPLKCLEWHGLFLKVLETGVSCPLPSMPLTGAILSLKNEAKSSAVSSNLRRSLAFDVLHGSVQCQDTVSSALPHVTQKPLYRSLLSSLAHRPNNIRQKNIKLKLTNSAFISTIRYFLFRKSKYFSDGYYSKSPSSSVWSDVSLAFAPNQKQLQCAAAGIFRRLRKIPNSDC